MTLFLAAMTFQSCEDVPMPYDMPGDNPTDKPEEPKGEAVGDGTLENPFNAVAANNYAKELGSDVESTGDVYIKGKVVSIEEEYSTDYGNGSYTISEDGTDTNTFKVWRALYLGNKKYTSGQDQIKVGDEVIVCGKVVNFKGNTPETVQGKAYLYSLNGKTEGGTTVEGEAKGTGTKEDPFNSVAANKKASELAADKKSEESYYIKGKIVSIKESFGAQYGNASFYISDDGKEAGQFYAFRVLYLGNKKYEEGQDQIKVGDEVVVYGKLLNYYGNTPETAQGEAYLYSLNGKTESTGNGGTGGDTGGGDTGGGEVSENSITVTPVSFGLSNATAATNITLADGTMLTFDGGGNTNAPKFYTTGNNIRMYPKNSMTITSSKNIKSVVMTCDVASGNTYNASGDISVAPGKLSVNDAVVTVSDVNAKEMKLTNTSSTTGAASQIRWIKLVINYAE